MYKVQMKYVKRFNHVMKDGWIETATLDGDETDTYLAYTINELIEDHRICIDETDMTLLEDLVFSFNHGKLSEFIRVWGNDIIVELGEMTLFVEIDKD